MMKTRQKSPSWRSWLRRGLIGMLLVAAGWLLWNEETGNMPPAEAPEPSPHVQAETDERSAREAAYESDKASLERLLENGATDEETRAQAAKQLEGMIAYHQSELAVEEALRRAGYDPTLVVMTNGALTVMVPPSQMEDSAAILALCAAHAEVPAENIRLMTAR